VSKSAEQRVVITGMGIAVTLGESLAQFWSGLVSGKSGIARLDVDPRCECRIGADMMAFNLDAHLGRVGEAYPAALVASARRTLRATPVSGNLTGAAAVQAFVDAGLGAGSYEPERIANVLGGHNLNSTYIVENATTYVTDPEYIDPLFGMMAFDTDVLGAIGQILELKGPAILVGGACASGNLAALTALDMIRAGRADAAIVSGGAASTLSAVLQGWVHIDAVSCRSFNDAPERASRPFDARREGFVPCVGAACVVLESLAGAKRRGARMYAELSGGAATSDASRLTKPHLEGQERAMRLALRDAGINAEQVDYVNAHATSTPLGDATEILAIKSALGKRAYDVPVNATKSMTGHGLTSSGVIELVATALQIQHGVLHPTINQEEKDPALDLDFVPNEARDHRISVALSNSFGFGGINSCLVVERTP
jgi:3-oxoacyl-(acyl-carrier-protein) synthase